MRSIAAVEGAVGMEGAHSFRMPDLLSRSKDEERMLKIAKVLTVCSFRVKKGGTEKRED